MDKLLPIDLPPGVYANGTEYETKGRWLEADLIRWFEGKMRPIGGWQRFTSAPLPEPARGCHTWRRNDNQPFAMFGTASHLFETSGSTTTDVTPVLGPPDLRSVTTAATGGTLAANTYYYVITALNAAGQTVASNEVSVTTTGTTSANTITWGPLSATVTSFRVWRGTATGAENTYYTASASAVSFVDTGATGTSGTLPATNTATGVFTAGFVGPGLGGYGSGNYSAGNYGQSGAQGAITDATTWDIDNFGQIALALSSTDGKLYQWDASLEPPNATLVAASGATAVPTGATGMFVTDDRICVLLGAGGNPRELVWSNQGDYTMWDVNVNTTAGDLQLKSNGRVMSGAKCLGTNLIWTDSDVHSLTYVGYPFIYGTNRIGSNCGLIARKAFSAMVNMAVWMGSQAFYMYNGVVQELPCEVRKAVFDNLNQNYRSLVCSGVNSQYSEVWWFFPSLNATENDSYVYWNFKDNHWGIGLGVLGRTCWTDKDVWPFPVACGADYNLYEHESGWTNAGVSRNGIVAAISGPLDVGGGAQIVNGNQMIYDTNDGDGELALSILTKYTSNGKETTWGPYVMRSDGYTDARFNGRQMKMSLAQTEDGLWQWGNLRIMATLGGAR